MGHKALSKVQLGGETVPGTAVPADTIWRGPFAGLTDSRETIDIEEDIGVAMPSSRKYAAKLFAEASFPSTPFTPEQSPHLLEAGIKAVGTGVADGSTSSGYVYEYPFGLTSINTVKSYTIESGDESQAEEAEYCTVKDLVISAVRGEVLNISAEWFGRQVVDATFTPALTAPAVSEVSANDGTIYIDDVTGAFGDTAIACGNILEVTLNVSTGRVPLFTADCGVLYFNSAYFNIDNVEASLEIKWIHDTAALAERAKWKTNTNRLMRVEFAGDAYGTPGSGTALNGFKGLQIDFPGSYESFSAVEHEDGKSIVTAKLTGGYDAASGEVLTLRVFNELTALP